MMRISHHAAGAYASSTRNSRSPAFTLLSQRSLMVVVHSAEEVAEVGVEEAAGVDGEAAAELHAAAPPQTCNPDLSVLVAQGYLWNGATFHGATHWPEMHSQSPEPAATHPDGVSFAPHEEQSFAAATARVAHKSRVHIFEE